MSNFWRALFVVLILACLLAAGASLHKAHDVAIEGAKVAIRCHSRCGGQEKTLSCGVFGEEKKYKDTEYSICIASDTGYPALDSTLIFDQKAYGNGTKIELFMIPGKKEKPNKKLKIKKKKPESIYL